VIRRETSPAFLGSLLLHVTFAALLIISWSLNRNLKEGSVVPITIVSTAPPSEDVRPTEQAPVEQSAATEEPVPTAPMEAAPPTPQPKPTPQPPAPTPVPKLVKPIPTPAPAKPAPPAKPEKSLDLDALSASISKMTKPAKPSSAPKGPAHAETAPVARQTVGTGVSALAMNGLVTQLRKHWHPNCEVEGAKDVNIKVTFTIGMNGQVDPGSASAGASENSSNPVIKAAAERAVRSIYEVAALKLITPDFYGQRVTATFPGNEACS
jgi:outer membrane biosynthesis protein TonB